MINIDQLIYKAPLFIKHSQLLWTELFQHFAPPVNIHESQKKMYTTSIHQEPFRARSNAVALRREIRNFLKLPSKSAFKKRRVSNMRGLERPITGNTFTIKCAKWFWKNVVT